MKQATQATPSADIEADIQILQFALRMEYLAHGFYEEAKAFDFGDTPSGASINQLISLLQLHGAAHIGTLIEDITQRGGTPDPRPALVFDIADEVDFLTQASDISSLLVHTYYGGMDRLASSRILVGAQQFAAVNAKFAAIVAAISGGNPLETAAPYLAPDEVITQTAHYFAN